MGAPGTKKGENARFCARRRGVKTRTSGQKRGRGVTATTTPSLCQGGSARRPRGAPRWVRVCVAPVRGLARRGVATVDNSRGDKAPHHQGTRKDHHAMTTTTQTTLDERKAQLL